MWMRPWVLVAAALAGAVPARAQVRGSSAGSPSTLEESAAAEAEARRWSGKGTATGVEYGLPQGAAIVAGSRQPGDPALGPSLGGAPSGSDQAIRAARRGDLEVRAGGAFEVQSEQRATTVASPHAGVRPSG